MSVVNKSKTVAKVSLKKLILEEFTRENGKVFYSIEVTPKAGLRLDFTKLKTLPLFVDLTWIKDDNLKFPLNRAPAFEIAERISCSQVVNSVTCFNLTETHLDDILGGSEVIRNFTVLRGGKVVALSIIDNNVEQFLLSDIVSADQKFNFANELITAIRDKAVDTDKQITIFAAGYPERHAESQSLDEDLSNLKRKVESGVDVILTQVVFSPEKFAAFVKNCRLVGIVKPIIPGLYIPLNLKQLDLMLRITKVSIDHEVYANFKRLEHDNDMFRSFSVEFMTKLIADIQTLSTEFIRGFHFFTLNNFEMVNMITDTIKFSEQ